MIQKTKFKPDIHKPGIASNSVLRAIASHNGGNIVLSIEDFISYAVMDRAIFSALRDGFVIERDEDENNVFHVSEDNGKTRTMSVQEITLEQLDDIPGKLFTSPAPEIEKELLT